MSMQSLDIARALMEKVKSLKIKVNINPKCPTPLHL